MDDHLEERGEGSVPSPELSLTQVSKAWLACVVCVTTLQRGTTIEKANHGNQMIQLVPIGIKNIPIATDGLV